MPDEPDRPARLPVDRAFHLKGLGVVVTGTLGERRHPRRATRWRSCLPGRAGARAQRPGPRPAARAGGRRRAHVPPAHRRRPGGSRPRHAARHAGGVRGHHQPARPLHPAAGRAGAGARLRPRAPPPLRQRGAGAHAPARTPRGSRRGRPGRSRSASQAPVSALRGDRFILRRPSPPATLGGGEILDPRWRRHRGTILQQALTALQKDLHAALPFWVQEAGERGVEAAELARRLGVPPAAGGQAAGGARPRPEADRGARGARAGPALDRPRRRAAGHRAGPPGAQGAFPEGPTGRVDLQSGGGAPHPARPGGGAGGRLPRLARGAEGARRAGGSGDPPRPQRPAHRRGVEALRRRARAASKRRGWRRRPRARLRWRSAPSRRSWRG